MFTSSRVNNIRVAPLLAGLLSMLLANMSVASGGIGGGGTSGTAGGIGGAPPRQVDEAYEYGKAVFLGRLPNEEKVPYCLLVDGEAKKVKRRTLKPYRRKTQSALANALYRCDDPSKLALKSVKQEQVAFVLYYLNKRFKLKLSDA